MKTKKSIFAAILLSFIAVAARAEIKIATIDLQKVFDGYYKTKQADAMLKKEGSEMQNQHQEMLDSLKKGEDEWKKLLDKSNDQAISSSEREKAKKDSEKKLLELKGDEQTLDQFDRASRTKLSEKERSTRDKILAEIRDAVEARAKASGFNMVIDSAAQTVNATPVLLYNTGENDLTTNILNQINSGAPTGSLDSTTKSADDQKKK